MLINVCMHVKVLCVYEVVIHSSLSLKIWEIVGMEIHLGLCDMCVQYYHTYIFIINMFQHLIGFIYSLIFTYMLYSMCNI